IRVAHPAARRRTDCQRTRVIHSSQFTIHTHRSAALSIVNGQVNRMSIDLSPEEFRRLGYRAVDALAEHFASFADRPARSPGPDAIRHHLMDRDVPQEGTDADRLLDDIASIVLRYPMGNGSPRFFGWVNSPAAPLAVLADLLAAGLNPSVAGGDHAATYI